MRWLAGHELRSLPGLPEHRLPRHVPQASARMPSSSPSNIIAGCHCSHCDSPRPPRRRSDSTRRLAATWSSLVRTIQGDSCADFRLSLHRPRGSAAKMAGMFAVQQSTPTHNCLPVPRQTRPRGGSMPAASFRPCDRRRRMPNLQRQHPFRLCGATTIRSHRDVPGLTCRLP